MVWGCMTWVGVGKLAKVDGRMDSAQYCAILASSLTPTMDALGLLPGFPPRDQLVSQQDNDPKHVSRRTTDWLQGAGISPMVWPAQSPDLNPIEHLWQHLKARIRDYPEPARSVHEMWDRAAKEWSLITVATCQKLIESMPRRVAAVIKAGAARSNIEAPRRHSPKAAKNWPSGRPGGRGGGEGDASKRERERAARRAHTRERIKIKVIHIKIQVFKL